MTLSTKQSHQDQNDQATDHMSGLWTSRFTFSCISGLIFADILQTFSSTEKMANGLTVFENHRKCLIQHCERSELHLHFEWPKVH